MSKPSSPSSRYSGSVVSKLKRGNISPPNMAVSARVLFLFFSLQQQMAQQMAQMGQMPMGQYVFMPGQPMHGQMMPPMYPYPMAPNMMVPPYGFPQYGYTPQYYPQDPTPRNRAYNQQYNNQGPKFNKQQNPKHSQPNFQPSQAQLPSEDGPSADESSNSTQKDATADGDSNAEVAINSGASGEPQVEDSNKGSEKGGNDAEDVVHGKRSQSNEIEKVGERLSLDVPVAGANAQVNSEEKSHAESPAVGGKSPRVKPPLVIDPSLGPDDMDGEFSPNASNIPPAASLDSVTSEPGTPNAFGEGSVFVEPDAAEVKRPPSKGPPSGGPRDNSGGAGNRADRMRPDSTRSVSSVGSFRQGTPDIGTPRGGGAQGWKRGEAMNESIDEMLSRADGIIRYSKAFLISWKLHNQGMKATPEIR